MKRFDVICNLTANDTLYVNTMSKIAEFQSDIHGIEAMLPVVFISWFFGILLFFLFHTMTKHKPAISYLFLVIPVCVSLFVASENTYVKNGAERKIEALEAVLTSLDTPSSKVILSCTKEQSIFKKGYAITVNTNPELTKSSVDITPVIIEQGD